MGPPPVPRGFRSVTPYLSVQGGAAALDFYQKAFGAKELLRQTTPDGKVIHGRLRIGDSIVMLSDVFPGAPTKSPMEAGGTTTTLHIYSRDVDKLWERAVAAGCRVSMPLEDAFWGERYGQLTDPFGHQWSLSMAIRMTPAEKEAKRRAAMSMFASAEPASSE